MDSKSGVDIDNARREEQVNVMKRIIADGICPFCHDFVDNIKPAYHSNPVLLETDHWVVTRNAWPYDDTKEHLIIVVKRHILIPEEMTDDEKMDFWNIVEKIKKRLEITHSTILMRSDSTKKTGATVFHLHAQLVVVKDGLDGFVTKIG